MKLTSLHIRNLRAIRRFDIEELGNFILIAGQNGSGKSCVFDAIRLLKSVYGGHLANEYQQWFGEFGINLQDRAALMKLFRSRESSIEIRASVAFAPSELEFITSNAHKLAEPLAWVRLTGQPADYFSFSQIAYLAQLRNLQPVFGETTATIATAIVSEISKPSHDLGLFISPNGEIHFENCLPVEAAFQAYEPRHLGVIEYHSASRSYGRQQVAGVNLDARAFEDQARQSRLYNWQNKYQNVKTELASSYIRGLISGMAGGADDDADLDRTLRELFHTFFPDKAYEGVKPQAGGTLEFPVRLSTGERHDIDELSSGEKEILYGFLKLKNSTPRNSIVLLDEPELHLHPSLLSGFADFYYRRLGIQQNNQIWLVTHSDTLLRQAVGNTNYKVVQMVPASSPESPVNQAVEVLADADVDRVTISLVGDLATYRPHGKVVILEGEHEDGFDVEMVRRLFPDFDRRVNLVSGGSKARVASIHDALQKAATSAHVMNRFFAVLDKDYGAPRIIDSATTVFSWDAYHIENYLLDAGAICAACKTLLGKEVFNSEAEVDQALVESAQSLIDKLVTQRLITEVNSRLINAISIGGDPNSGNPDKAIAASLKNSVLRVNQASTELSDQFLEELAADHRSEVKAAISDGSWRRELPGREILDRFAGTYMEGKVSGKVLRFVILEKLAERSYKPEGMGRVIDAIATR